MVVLRVAFVKGEAFEDEGDEFVGGFVVEFDEAGAAKQPINLSMIETAKLYFVALALLQQIVNRKPLQACPFFHVVVGADHDDDEIGLAIVEIR